MRLALAILLLIPGLAKAVTTNVAANFAEITNALANSASGDIINVGPGTVAWSAPVWITAAKDVRLVGSGTNSTAIVFGNFDSPFWLKTGGGGLNEFAGFNLVGATNHPNGVIQIGQNPETKFNGFFRIHDILMTNVIYRGLQVGYGDAFGLIDHCTLLFAPDNLLDPSKGANPLTFGGNSTRSWTNANPLGTTNAVYVEDCYIGSRSNKGNGWWDSYEGAQFVVRHCTLEGWAYSGTHGYDSGDNSPRSFEIYANTVINGHAGNPFLEIRGGTGVIYSNSVAGYDVLAMLCCYRCCLSDHTSTGHGQLDGATTNVLDGNIDGTGYPGHQQVGVIISSATTSTQTLLPLYQWNNGLNGTNGLCQVQGPYACGNQITNIIKLNRNYFDSTPMPAYTALVYPHPLQGVIATPVGSIEAGPSLDKGTSTN